MTQFMMAASPLMSGRHAMRRLSTAVRQADAVKKFELFKVAPRWLLLRMETENGIVGWGEPNLEGYSATVATCVGELMRSVIGEDPSRIQHIWQKLHRQKFYSGGAVIMSSISGIDQALDDSACGTSESSTKPCGTSVGELSECLCTSCSVAPSGTDWLCTAGAAATTTVRRKRQPRQRRCCGRPTSNISK
jgi:hypothetical protein